MKVRLQRTLSCSGDAKCQIVQTQRYPREVLFALGGWHDGAPTNHMEVYGKRKHTCETPTFKFKFRYNYKVKIQIYECENGR